METILKRLLDKGLSISDVERISLLAGNDSEKLIRYAQRRLFGEPFAYIEGAVQFHGHRFLVDRRVYVPNPETEQIVDVFLAALAPGSHVLDVGTGSGAIAITIAKEFPGVTVSGVDIDPGALAVARANATLHHVDVLFYESCYVDNLDVRAPDFIISDLPYGDSSFNLPSIDMKEFKHMPPIALYHPAGLLVAYEELIQSIFRRGWRSQLFFESGLMSKAMVETIIPDGLGWEYAQIGSYSLCRVQF